MKILIIGGTGTIGKAVANELGKRHKLIIAGSKTGDVQVDIENVFSIEKMYQSVDSIDAVVITTGKTHFASLTEMTAEHYAIGLRNKLMGQINVVLTGLKYLNSAGSFTLTSGILNRDPIRFATSSAMVNGAIDAFVKAAAIDMPKNIRINVVSPTVLCESMDKLGEYFRGFVPVTTEKVALAYSKSIEGHQTGQVYYVQ